MEPFPLFIVPHSIPVGKQNFWMALRAEGLAGLHVINWYSHVDGGRDLLRAHFLPKTIQHYNTNSVLTNSYSG